MFDKEPGWYPDPIRGDAFDTARFWDGRAWTEQLRASTRAEKRAWAEAALAEKRERVAEVRARAAAGDRDAQAIVEAASAGTLRVAADEDHAAQVRLGGWWARFGAVTLDGFLMRTLSLFLSIRYIQQVMQIIANTIKSMQATQASGAPWPSPGPIASQLAGPLLAITAIYLAVTLVYEVGFVVAVQATPGKMLLGLQVQSIHGEGTVGVGSALVRWGVKIGVSLLNAIPFAGLVSGVFMLVDRLWPLWDERNQALHDKAARTIVVTSR